MEGNPTCDLRQWTYGTPAPNCVARYGWVGVGFDRGVSAVGGLEGLEGAAIGWEQKRKDEEALAKGNDDKKW